MPLPLLAGYHGSSEDRNPKRGGAGALAPPASADTRIIGTARVIDGDTLDVGPVRVRLHGIDAPEAGQRCGRVSGGTWRCGDRATVRLAELVDGEPIECSARDRDHYGRIIAVC